MIFYLAVGTDHKTKILGTQADAAKVNKEFVQIDIPTDKAGLMAWIQQMLDETLNAMEPEISGSTEPDTITICTADMRADKDGAPSISHTIPAPKPVVHHNAQVAEILTASEVYDFIETVGEKRLQDIEHSIAVRRDKLNSAAAKEADVKAD